MTYPTITGDLSMKNKHVGVNFDDRDIPEKNLPKEHLEGKATKDLEGTVKKLQRQNVNYNKEYYKGVQRKDWRAGGFEDDEIEDPRSLIEIEQENLEIKEQYIHQMMTLEQYL